MKSTRTLRVQTSAFVASIDVNENDVIIAAAPILMRFRGQPLRNLKNWIGRFTDVEVSEL